jgi:hypothetical protein
VVGSPRPARVFVSYAHEDRSWCEKLLAHLGPLTSSGRIHVFDDSGIEPGEWERQLRAELDGADVIVFIVTADFGNSPFCTGTELARGIERFQRDGIHVLPILAEHCDWQALPIARFQILPQDEQRNLKRSAIERYRDALARVQTLENEHRLAPADQWMPDDLRRRLESLGSGT